jgi:hypothetical protein
MGPSAVSPSVMTAYAIRSTVLHVCPNVLARLIRLYEQ